MLMRGTMSNVTFELRDFSALEKPLADCATQMTVDLFFPNGDFPPLKSNVIVITRSPTAPTPMYVANLPYEAITVNCAENRPWQYTYQLAHELGHLTTRSDTRHPRRDGNLWIEEAICGAYSVYAIRAMSETAGRMQHGALDYLRNDLNDYRAEEVNAEWFAQHFDGFRTATGLTGPLMKLSGYIAGRLPVSQVISDNRAIMHNPLNEDHAAYVSDWRRRCEGDENVPAILESLGHGTKLTEIVGYR
jgi:hypothetical protein